MEARAAPIDGPAAAELSRRVGAILDDVESEAARVREETRAEAERLLAEARREADDLIAERRRRIAALSDDIVEHSEAILSRLRDAAELRAGFDELVRALGEAAQRLAGEIEREEHEPHGPAPFAGMAADG